jgi:hypothetical protein
LSAAEVDDVASWCVALFEDDTDAVCDVLHRAEVAVLSSERHLKRSATLSASEEGREEPIAAIVDAGEGEGTNHGEMSLESIGACAKEAISGRFTGSIRMECVDGIIFAI